MPFLLPFVRATDDEDEREPGPSDVELIEEDVWDGADAPPPGEPPPPTIDDIEGPDEVDPDRVPVLHFGDHDDDVSSWDAEALPWGDEQSPEDGPADPDPDDPDPDDPEPDDPGAWGDLDWTANRAATESEDNAPTSPAYQAWRPARPRAGTPVRDSSAERPRLRSGGPDLSDEELERLWAEREAEAAGENDGDDEDGKPPERRAVDLLRQDDTAWGGGSATNGVIG